MKIENSIGWCDDTINAVTGCDKVSPGCKNCFAEVGTRARVLRARGIETWGPKGVRHPVNFEATFRRLNKLCICDTCHEAHPYERIWQNAQCCAGSELRRVRLFADSNSDWLDERWLNPGLQDTLGEFLIAIWKAPNINTLLLTKRIQNFERRLKAVFEHYRKASCNDAFCAWLESWLEGDAPDYVWLGVSVENQKLADERIPLLLKTPAAVRFLSCEPLLEKIDLSKWIGYHPINETEHRDGKTSLGCDKIRSVGSGFSGENLEAQKETLASVEAKSRVRQMQSHASGEQDRIGLSPNSSDVERGESAVRRASHSVPKSEGTNSNRNDCQPQERIEVRQQAEQFGVGDVQGTNEARNRSSGKRSPKEPQTISWIIVGAESGKNRRDCGVESIVDVAYQCSTSHVPVYVKQDCAFHSGQQGRIPNDVWQLKQFPR